MARRLAAVLDAVPSQDLVVEALKLHPVATRAADVRQKEVDPDRVQQMRLGQETPAALALGAAVELDHGGARLRIDAVEEARDWQAVEALVNGLDGADEVVRRIRGEGAPDAARPFVDLRRVGGLLPAHEKSGSVGLPGEVVAGAAAVVVANDS